MPDFMPRQEQESVRWIAHFADGIDADPQKYAIDIDAAAAYRARVQAYIEAYRVSQDPGARTCVSVSAKDALRSEVVRQTRFLSKRVRGVETLTPTDLIDLGLRPRKPKVRRRPAPTTAPQIEVSRFSGRSIEVRLFDAELPRKVAKPTNVAYAALWIYRGDAPPAHESHWAFARNTTRTRCTIELEGSIAFGQRIWLVACWCSPTQEQGPFSRFTSTRIVEDAELPTNQLAA